MSSEPEQTPAEQPASGRKGRGDTRARIVDAAGSLYAKQGITPTTVDQIAEAAGLSTGAVYRYFGSKQEVALAFIDEGISLVERYLDEAREAPTPLLRLYAAGEAYFRFAVELPIASRFAAIRVLQPDSGPEYEAINQAFSERMHRIILAVATDVKGAMDAGQLYRGPIDAAMIFLWGSWNGVTALMLRQDALAIAPDAAERALEFGRRMMRTAIAYAVVDPDAAEAAASDAPPPFQLPSAPHGPAG